MRRYRVYTIWDTGRKEDVGKYKTFEEAKAHALLVKIGATFQHGVVVGAQVTGPDAHFLRPHVSR